VEAEDLQLESPKKRNSKLMNQAKQHSFIERIDRDRDIHHFIESSRMLVEE
jgi:hypothetical protein